MAGGHLTPRPGCYVPEAHGTAAGRSSGRSGRLPLPGFEPRTVTHFLHAVVADYMDLK